MEQNKQGASGSPPVSLETVPKQHLFPKADSKSQPPSAFLDQEVIQKSPEEWWWLANLYPVSLLQKSRLNQCSPDL